MPPPMTTTFFKNGDTLSGASVILSQTLWDRRPRLGWAHWPGLDFTGRRRPANAPAAGRGPAPLHEFWDDCAIRLAFLLRLEIANHLDAGLDVFHRRFRQNAMAQIEDV